MTDLHTRADTITIVRAPGRRLAKLIRADHTAEPYDRTKTVDLLTAEVPGLDSLAALLRGADLADSQAGAASAAALDS